MSRPFVARLAVPVPAAELFAWHERPGAFERLSPPWQDVRVLGASGGIRDGARITLRVGLAGPVGFTWRLGHVDYVAGSRFRDRQLSGPLGRWEHTHLVEPAGPHSSTLTDSLEVGAPFPASLPVAASVFDAAFRPQLRRLFAFRHAVTAADLDRHAQFAAHGALRIAVSGATGLIGRQLCAFLSTGGHTVLRLVRPGRGDLGPTDVAWDPDAGTIDAAYLDGVDAVIHLAGEPVSERWTAEHKRAILGSRVAGTGLLARTIAALPRPPRVFLSTSAVGYYGDTGDREVDEGAAAGDDFLADVSTQWEAAADPARDAGIRVVHPRLGVVLSPRGGALARLLPPFRLGAGGKLGSGQQ
jgi:ligand-binding SRPBCC domain-containing protein